MNEKHFAKTFFELFFFNTISCVFSLYATWCMCAHFRTNIFVYCTKTYAHWEYTCSLETIFKRILQTTFFTHKIRNLSPLCLYAYTNTASRWCVQPDILPYTIHILFTFLVYDSISLHLLFSPPYPPVPVPTQTTSYITPPVPVVPP